MKCTPQRVAPSHPERTRSLVHLQCAAVRALYYELTCSPKPGLVTLHCSGSHKDMNAGTFFRSLVSQRAYYLAIARAGAEGAEFETLKQLGMQAERRMLAATGGVNTHRGAIFSLGLLTAAAARLRTHGQSTHSDNVAAMVRDLWGDAIARSRRRAPRNPGMAVFSRYGADGARGEASLGFPTIINVVLPSFRAALASGATLNAASVQALFSAIAVLEDTNLLYRGGAQGLRFARRAAETFLSDGGVLRSDWQTHAGRIADAFVGRNLSPGGSADALTVSLLFWQLDRGRALPAWA